MVQEFALKHAFDQQDAEQEIEYCRESLVDVQHELEDAYRMTLTSEAATGILRKETMRFDTSKAKMYKVGAAVNLVKLVVLQSNMSVSESEKGDSRWVYVPKDELDRVIKEGSGDVYGYVNQNTNMCRLRFDVDAANNLVIRDIANRGILVSLVTQEGLDVELYQKWLTQSEKAVNQLSEAEHHIRLSLIHI